MFSNSIQYGRTRDLLSLDKYLVKTATYKINLADSVISQNFFQIVDGEEINAIFKLSE